jgi:GNAT superfamily N-acetyltransferase
MQLRPARPDEAALVSDLAVRSKAYWGYDEKFLAGSRVQLAVRPEDVVDRRVTVAEVAGVVAGFYSLDGVPPAGELGLMFVDPDHIRTGVGTRLFEHAVATARAVGFEKLLIDADPFAEAFYVKMGAYRTGWSPSAVKPGRELPQLTFAVPSA